MTKLVDMLLDKLNSKDTTKFSEKNIFTGHNTWIHTGSPELDYNLGVLGFPVGLTEISGPSKSGKTTLALCAMFNFQKKYPDGISIILSSEERDNKIYAEQIGVDTEKVIIIRSKFLEDLFYKFQIHIDEIAVLWSELELPGKPKIFVMWDSVGATNSRAELETFKDNVATHKKAMEKGTKGEIKHAKMGDFAKTARSCMKAILAQIYDKDIVFIMLNHRYDIIGSTVGGTKSTGGTWIEFLPCLRLETVRTGWERLDEVQTGQYTAVKVEKNDFGSRKTTTIEILLGYGVVLSQDDIDFAIEKGIMKKEGAKKVTFMGDKLKFSTKREFYKLYQDRNKFLQILHSKITQARHSMVLEEKDLK